LLAGAPRAQAGLDDRQQWGGKPESQPEGGQVGRAVGAAGSAGGCPRRKARSERTAGGDTPSGGV
jgi:hypothetical protein